MTTARNTTYYNTKGKALHEANALLQRVGFNNFSFQHIADSIGIKKPSLYDHFRSKEELGIHLIDAYRTKFQEWTDTISSFNPTDQIGAFFELFFKFSTDGRKLCPLSALIADYNAIPETMEHAVSTLLHDQQTWLNTIIHQGQSQQIFRSDIPNDELVNTILSMGFGAQLVARAAKNPDVIRTAKYSALQLLTKS